MAAVDARPLPDAVPPPDAGPPPPDAIPLPDVVVLACGSRGVTTPTSDFFIDVSAASGIQLNNFTPNPATPIPINDHSRLAVVDIDGDGWDDIVMHNLFPDPQGGVPFEHLVFLNNHDGTFRDFSDESGLRHVQAAFFTFGDVDNDGDLDVFTGLDIPLTGENNHIYLNDGHGHFTLKANSGVEDPIDADTVTGNAVFADFNNDGKLDLYLGNGQTSYIAANQLYFGNGDGTFTEVTATNILGDNTAQPTNGLVACDYDDDGDLDIFVSTYGVSESLGHKHLWQNDGTGHFTDVAEQTGFAALGTGNYWLASTGMGTMIEPSVDPSMWDGSNGFGIECQDIDGDGYPDIYMATISHPVDSDYSRKWSDPSQLLINQGPSGGFTFKNVYLDRGLPFNEGDIDNAAIDFDNDGYIDLAVTRDNKYESSYTTYDQKSWFGLFHQLPSGQFESLGMVSGINDLTDTASPPRMKAGQNQAWIDYDHDGDLDLVVGGRDHGGGRPNFLFENVIGSQNTWMAIRVKGDGVDINRDAIGAKVTVTGGGRVFTRERKSSRGTYDSADTAVLMFGLGAIPCDYGVQIRWPNGKIQSFTPSDIPLNRYVTIDYVNGVSLD